MLPLHSVAIDRRGTGGVTSTILGVPTEYSVRVVAVAVAGQTLIRFSGRMIALFVALLASFRAAIRSRLELATEILALRHQLAVLQRGPPTLLRSFGAPR